MQWSEILFYLVYFLQGNVFIYSCCCWIIKIFCFQTESSKKKSSKTKEGEHLSGVCVTKFSRAISLNFSASKTQFEQRKVFPNPKVLKRFIIIQSINSTKIGCLLSTRKQIRRVWKHIFKKKYIFLNSNILFSFSSLFHCTFN